MNDESLQLNVEPNAKYKDIDEALRFKVVEFLGKAEDSRANGDMVKSYSYLRSIFGWMRPSPFKHKDLLINYTNMINGYINNLGVRPIDMRHKLEIQGQEYELRELIDKYFELIPECMKELSLYFRILKNKNDMDEQFSEETFNTNISLLKAKRDKLIKLDSDSLFSFLTPNQVHDVYSRLMDELNLREHREEIENE